MDHSKTVPQLADAPLNLFIKNLSVPFLANLNSLNPPPPPPLLLSLPLSLSTTKIMTGHLAAIIQDYFKKRPWIENSEGFPIHLAT